MRGKFPEVHIVRHGQTAWSLSGQHTGRSDIPLTEAGEEAARGVAGRLAGLSFSAVWSSPSQRASRTCELAGFGGQRIIKDDLAEWAYGDYEGLKTAEIQQKRPGWEIFRDGCPNGETAADVAARADRIIAEARKANDDILIFSSSHFLRVLGARWIGLPPEMGRHFMLDTTSIGLLGYDHNLDQPAIKRWNQV